MLNKIFNTKTIFLLILIQALFLRVYNLNYPEKYYFDEVYHAYTASEYLKANKQAWHWSGGAPQGFAYEWTHPPLAKEIMTLFMYIFGPEQIWAHRIAGVIFFILSLILLFYICLSIFKSEKIALLTTFLYSLDGLTFVLSRIGMNDIYFITFMLATLLFYINKRYFISSIFLGLALACKWTGFYLGALIFLLTLINFNKDYINKRIKILLYFGISVPIIYLISYIPVFYYYDFSTFIHLQKQMWWYHTRLVATHGYSSPWWSWIFNLFPVWYFAQYWPDGTLSNIYASGNNLLFITGFVAIIKSSWDLINNKKTNLILPILGYCTFLVPWALSPRIMFLYHYAPAIPFLCILLSYQIINLNKKIISGLLVFAIILNFAFLYPFLTGIPLKRDTYNKFFLTNLNKNPLG